MNAQLDSLRQAAERRGAAPARAAAARVIAVGSGKGGVGTSTVATLLAATMAEAGHDVLLVDSGERIGALHHLLGVEPERTVASLRGGGAEPEDLLVHVAERLAFLPGASSPQDAALPASERRMLFRRAASLYERYALVVVDAGATAESILATCAEGVGRFLAVTGVDRISVVATYALVKTIHQRFPATAIEVLANRGDDVTSHRALEHLGDAAERFLGRPVPVAGTVPHDHDFASAMAAGLGAHEAAAGSSAAVALRSIGERILAELDTPSRQASHMLRLHPRG